MSSESCKYPQFPQEILDCFIDCLAARNSNNRLDVATLCTCTLVSRAFAHRARGHIFRDVCITADSDDGQEADSESESEESMGNEDYMILLHELITWKPRHSSPGGLTAIYPYIKSLRCCCELGPEDGRWEDLMSTILHAIHGPEHGITKFVFNFSGRWDRLALGLRCAIRDLLLSPHLVKFRATDIEGLPRTLLIGSRIKQLALEKCSVEASEGALYYSSRYPYATASYPLLEMVDIDNVGIMYRRLFEREDKNDSENSQSALSALQTLRMYPRRKAKKTTTLYECMKSTVQYIDIQFDDRTSVPASTFDLRAMEDLNRLRIQHHRFERSMSFSPALQIEKSGYSILDVLRVPTSLRTFSLKYAVNIGGEHHPPVIAVHETFFAPPEVNEWTRLNEFFSSPGFAAVTRVFITLSFWVDWNEGVPGAQNPKGFFSDIKTFVRHCLPYFSKPTTTCVLSVFVTVKKDDYNDDF
ncbi:unnamed protein product [Cyclocybe aegerita]|uniref:F-box domain-containing protein n=1 Tax=Cyclocybe aegerita TaxID=1973307 RepID=A0A8S0XFD1_CYCAE|nr:unnamed protein product [Cyclocybe aegerita]